MASRRDLTQAGFEEALSRHEITHKGDAWNKGTYYFAGTGWPVMGLSGPQLDITSRRRLLADLIGRRDGKLKREKEVAQLKALPRGARVAAWNYGVEKHAIVVQPYGPNDKNEHAIEVSFNGVRRRWNPLRDGLMIPEGKWAGPKDLVHALEMERDKAAEALKKCNVELSKALSEGNQH